MNPDTLIPVLTIVAAFGVVLYLVWSNRHYRDLKDHQQDLLRQVQQELDRNETASLKRHGELQRQLAEQRRILISVSRRLY